MKKYANKKRSDVEEYKVENLVMLSTKDLKYQMVGRRTEKLTERFVGLLSRTEFRSNVQRRRGMYLAIIERRLRRRDKDVRAESDLLNDLGFNLYVAPQSPVVRLVAYFGVKEVAKTEVLRSRVKELEWIR